MIHVVTCWTRTPDVLDRIYQSLQSLTIPYHWFIVTPKTDIDFSSFQNTTKLIKPDIMPMHTGVNYYYDVVPDTGQWVYVLDDDNLIHKNLSIIKTFLEDLKCDIIVLGQQLDPDSTRVLNNAQDINIQKIDNGQFVLRRAAVGKLRYWPIYRGDGYFITEMRIVTTEKNRGIAMLPVIGTYYNAQHWLN